MLTALIPTLSLLLAPAAHASADLDAPHVDAPPTALAPQPNADVAPAVPTRSSASARRDENAPLYIGGRGSIAVPANGNGDVLAAGFGMGILYKDSQQFGLRFIYMHEPPSNPLASDTPAVPWAWGPVLDWQWTFRPEARASMFLASSLGYVYGTPKDGRSDNVILPIFEGGIGLRLSKKLEDGKRIYVAPQLGFVPGAVAPFSAIDIGMILPGGRQR